MTNALIMTAMLSTNWNGFMEMRGDGKTIQHAEVYRYVTFHTMEGTNRINWGYTTPMKFGTISKTNGVVGPITADQ